MVFAMKKAIWGMCALVLVVPLIAQGALFQKGNDSYVHPKNEIIRENVYAGAPQISIKGPVQGDAFLGGATVVVTGGISEDAMIVGGNVSILARVSEDARIIGGNVIVDDRVGGDLIIIGGSVTVTSNAVVDGDVTLLGGQVSIDGVLNRDLEVAGGEVVLSGTVRGNVRMMADKKVVLGDGAIIRGNLTYRAAHELVMHDNAQVIGKVIQEEPKWASLKGTSQFRNTVLGVIGTLFLIKLLTMFIGYLVLVGIAPKWTGKIVRLGQKDFWKQFVTGLVLAIVVPIVALLLAVTVVGIPFTIALASLYVLLLISATLFVGPVLGVALMRLMKQDDELNWKSALLGIVVFLLLRLVPLIGWAIDCVFMLLTMGIFAQLWYTKIWKNRQ